MNKYIITGSKFTGHILVWFRNQFLAKLSFDEAELTAEQKDWFIHFLSVAEPSFIPMFNSVKEKGTGKPLFVIRQEIELVTFEDFYNIYAYREGKKKALASWNKLSAADQSAAFQYIPKYKRKIQSTNTAMAYPASYLNQKRWED